MAYEQKTRENDNDVIAFLEEIENPRKKEDAYELLEIFTETSGHPPRMWGASMIGFGRYHYRYPTGHEGDSFLVGFSPRKGKTSLYLATGDAGREALLERLGKHTSGKACVYINKVADIDTDVLRQLIRQSIEFLERMYPEPK